MPKSRQLLIAVGFLHLILWFFYCANTAQGWNDQSRLATIESLVHRGTFIIDDSPYVVTGDKVRINNHYYGNKLPLLNLMATIPYFILKQSGFNIYTNENIVYIFLTFLFSFLPSIGILILAFKIAELLYPQWLNKKKSLPLFFGLVLFSLFGNLAWTYTTVFQSHVILTFFITCSVYFFLKFFKKPEDTYLYFAAAALGLALGLDLTCLFFVGAIVLYSILAFRKILKPQQLAVFLLLCGIPMFISLLIDYSISGVFKPLALQTEAYFFEGSQFSRDNLLFAADGSGFDITKSLTHLVFGTIGSRGVFSHAPLLVLGFVGLYLKVFKAAKTETLPKNFLLSLLLGILLTFVFYAFEKSYTFGGGAYGFRYMMFWMPVVSCFSGFLLLNNKFKGLFFATGLLSVILSFQGLSLPFVPHAGNELSSSTFDFIYVNQHLAMKNSLLRADPNQLMVKELSSGVKEGHPQKIITLAQYYFEKRELSSALRYVSLYDKAALFSSSPDLIPGDCYRARIFSKEISFLPDLFEKYQKFCEEKAPPPTKPEQNK